MKQPYVATEPEELVYYASQDGQHHLTRDEAIAVNFYLDLFEVVKPHARVYQCDPDAVVNALKTLALEQPDMLRVLLGDRDAT